MSPCCGKEAQPLLRLVTSPNEIAPDVVFALRSHAYYDIIGASYASVRSRPVIIQPRNARWELL